MIRVVVLVFALIVVLDFAWIWTHWVLHPDLSRHAEYLGALAALLYAIDRIVVRIRRKER